MSATTIDWVRVKAIFDAAVVLDPQSRTVYLDRACGADDSLRGQVEALLGSHDDAGTFLETPAVTLIEGPPENLIGRSIDSYHIVSRLGEGGMGEVYEAHDAKLDRVVALKLLHRRVAADADRLRRFRAEARAASSLNHPNILVIHDFGDLDGRPFFVSELVDGQTLRQRLDGGAVPVREAIGIAIQVADALAAAHGRGIVHRDIKPENLMLRPDGYVKVLDFGLTKLVDAPSTDATAHGTQAGVLLGTPHYMSPEQAEGKPVDERSDLFSLGVILYELTTGARPFTGDTHVSVLASILRDTPKPVTELNQTLPRDLARIISQCLAKDRERRYRSAKDLRHDLDELGRGPWTAGLESASVIDSLAVLPFVNAGGDPDTEYLSDGIAETLINRLSQLPGLRVVPRSTTFRYKGRDIDPNEAGLQLKVRAVLTGKVSQRGETLNVQADLVDVVQEAQLWGERFVRSAVDIFAVEDDIAARITDKLRLKVTGEDRDRSGRRYTENTEAYHLFLKGRYYWSKRTRPNLQKSVGYFEEAIAADPGYALPYAGLADAYVVMSVFDAGVPADLLSKGQAAARRALEIDPDLAEAHAELCLTGPSLDRNWDAADEAFRSAMKRQPSYWLAHDHYAMTLAARGRFDEAVAQVRQGQTLEPLSLVVPHHVAWICFLARRYDEAIAECRSAIDMDPSFPMAHLWMGISLEQKGLYDEAIASLDRAVERMGGTSIGVAAAAHAYALAGRTEEARRRFSELQQTTGGRYVQPYGLALVAAALGDTDGALHWLEKADRDRDFWWTMWGNVDPRLDGMRGDVRFRDLLQRLGIGANQV